MNQNKLMCFLSDSFFIICLRLFVKAIKKYTINSLFSLIALNSSYCKITLEIKKAITFILVVKLQGYGYRKLGQISL